MTLSDKSGKLTWGTPPGHPEKPVKVTRWASNPTPSVALPSELVKATQHSAEIQAAYASKMADYIDKLMMPNESELMAKYIGSNQGEAKLFCHSGEWELDSWSIHANHNPQVMQMEPGGLEKLSTVKVLKSYEATVVYKIPNGDAADVPNVQPGDDVVIQVLAGDGCDCLTMPCKVTAVDINMASLSPVNMPTVTEIHAVSFGAPAHGPGSDFEDYDYGMQFLEGASEAAKSAALDAMASTPGKPLIKVLAEHEDGPVITSKVDLQKADLKQQLEDLKEVLNKMHNDPHFKPVDLPEGVEMEVTPPTKPKTYGRPRRRIRLSDSTPKTSK